MNFKFTCIKLVNYTNENKTISSKQIKFNTSNICATKKQSSFVNLQLVSLFLILNKNTSI